MKGERGEEMKRKRARMKTERQKEGGGVEKVLVEKEDWKRYDKFVSPFGSM